MNLGLGSDDDTVERVQVLESHLNSSHFSYFETLLDKFLNFSESQFHYW